MTYMVLVPKQYIWKMSLEVPQFTPELRPNNTYTWQVLVSDSAGNSTRGDVWSFSTVLNFPPDPPFNPSPSNNATNVDTEVTLSWSARDPEGNPMTYDVYWDTTPSEPIRYSGKSGLAIPQFTTYCPNHMVPLQRNTTYFWEVVVKDNAGNETKGEVWSFTTGARPANLSHFQGVVVDATVRGVVHEVTSRPDRPQEERFLLDERVGA